MEQERIDHRYHGPPQALQTAIQFLRTAQPQYGQVLLPPTLEFYRTLQPSHPAFLPPPPLPHQVPRPPWMRPSLPYTGPRNPSAPPSAPAICSICDEPIPVFFASTISHAHFEGQVCKSCVESWLDIKLMQEKKIWVPCPFPGCKRMLTSMDFRHIGPRFMQAHQELARDMHESRARRIVQEEPDLKAVLDNGYLQKCPNCLALMQKVDGCDSVECPACNVHFCYSCGERSCVCFFITQGLPSSGTFTCVKCLADATDTYTCTECGESRYPRTSVDQQIELELESRAAAAREAQASDASDVPLEDGSGGDLRRADSRDGERKWRKSRRRDKEELEDEAPEGEVEKDDARRRHRRRRDRDRDRDQRGGHRERRKGNSQRKGERTKARKGEGEIERSPGEGRSPGERSPEERSRADWRGRD